MISLVVLELAAPIAIALLVLTVRSRLYAGILSVLASSSSLTAALILHADVVSSGPQRVVLVSDWLIIPGIKPVSISFVIDPLSTVVSILLCGLSVIILTYSIEYMGGEGYDSRRYWFLILIFIASMLVIINTDNFILLLIGWEGVSLCSYLLIGYYYGDEKKYWIGGPPGKAPLHTPSYCSFRTLATVGSADSVMLVGILMLVTLTGSPYYEDLVSVKSLVSSGLPTWLVVTPLVLLLAGPLAKSAQFPLHNWLSYAMAGPTPVSALLHSATMVKAGVYLIIRLLPELVGISEVVSELSIIFSILVITGILSMVDGAVNAGRALELKKVLAYSTISQIGYMFLILGVAGFTKTPTNVITAGLYHMISHAIFKSALFLVAGILIHLSGTIYLNEVGLPLKGRSGLLLFLTVLIPCLNLLGIPPLVGFWSKEFIFEVMLFEELHIPFSVIILTTFLTALYTTRMMIFIFTQHKTQHEYHGVGKLMLYPVTLLVTSMVFIGIIGHDLKHALINILVVLEEEVELISGNPLTMVLAVLATISGVALALIRYEPKVLYLISPSTVATLTLKILKHLTSEVLKLGTLLAEVFTSLVSTASNFIRRVGILFNVLEYTLNTKARYVGIEVMRYLNILFRMIGYADMDSFLALYLLTLSTILTYVLVMYNLLGVG